MWGRGQQRQLSGRRSRLAIVSEGDRNVGRYGVREGISRRAVLERIPDSAFGSCQPPNDHVFHRGEGAWPTEIILKCRPVIKRSSADRCGQVESMSWRTSASYRRGKESRRLQRQGTCEIG